MTIYTTSFGTNNKERSLPGVRDHYGATQNDGGENTSHSTTRKWVNKLDSRYNIPAVKSKMNEEHRKIY